MPRGGLGRTVGSGFWLQIEKSKRFGLEGIRFGRLLKGRTRGIAYDLMGIPAAGGQMGQQRGQAMHGHTLGSLLCLLFGLGGFGNDRILPPAI